MALIVTTYVVMPPFYYLLKILFNPKTPLQLRDYYIMCLLLIFLVTGGYQLYFWSQKAYIGQVSEIQETWLDTIIPKWIPAVYVYNFLYYIGFGLVVVSFTSYAQFVHAIVAGIGLLLTHVILFVLFPTKLPDTSRSQDTPNKYLQLTQKYDSLHNAFPSAHVSISILVYFLVRGVFGEWALLFPILITLSCLLTKQHYVIDCLGGALLGISYCYAFQQLYPYRVF